MRITNQQILNQAGADLKKISGQSSNQLAKGQVLKAVVREIMQDGLILELKSGELIKASVSGGASFEKGALQSFEVVSSTDPTVLRPVGEESAQSLEQTLAAMFKGSSEKVTPEKLGAAKALLSFGQPLSKAGITNLIETSKQFETLKGLIESDMIKLDALPAKSPVKQILLAHYNGSNSQSGTSSQNNTELSAAFRNSLSASLGKLEQTATLQGDIKASVSQNTGTDSGLGLEKESVENHPVQPESQLNPENDKAAEGLAEKNAHTMTKLAAVLGQIDYQKLAFHKSAGMENTLLNLGMLEKLVFGSETIGKQIAALIQSLSENTSSLPEDVKAVLDQLGQMEMGKEEEAEKALVKILDTLEKSTSENEASLENVKEDVLAVKQSISYMREMNASMTYVQFPLQVDQEMHSVDLFLKKRKGKNRNEEEMTILIALDTQNMGMVQSLVDYKKSQLNIQFRVENEKTVEILSSDEAYLSEKLSEISSKDIQISFRVKERAHTNLDAIAELSSTSASGIDMRV